MVVFLPIAITLFSIGGMIMSYRQLRQRQAEDNTTLIVQLSSLATHGMCTIINMSTLVQSTADESSVYNEDCMAQKPE